ncbi:hypothetical protein V5N11_005921 [Cardamine amara subsp. amara]|uniref:Uncharacterized protein n=1 Tax=Cardamine amara subsp. amara TaxID=228776 RepID=A0ABD0ZPF5_CARAN
MAESLQPKDQVKWKPPDTGWLKCNIGSAWSNNTQLGGGGWVLRDETRKVLLHSRRAFIALTSKQDAMLCRIRYRT